MTTPYDPAQNQPGQQPMPPTAQFPQVPAGQYLPPPAGQYPPPAGQFPPGPAGQFPPAPPARKRPAWLVPTLIGVGAFVVLFCGGSMVIGLASDNG